MAAHGARDATGSEVYGSYPRLPRPVTSAEALDSLKATSGDLGEHIPLDRFDPLVCNQGRESFLISPSPVIALPVYLRAED